MTDDRCSGSAAVTDDARRCWSWPTATTFEGEAVGRRPRRRRRRPARSCSTPRCRATRRSSPTRRTPARSSRSPTRTSATTASTPTTTRAARPVLPGRDRPRPRPPAAATGAPTDDLDGFLRAPRRRRHRRHRHPPAHPPPPRRRRDARRVRHRRRDDAAARPRRPTAAPTASTSSPRSPPPSRTRSGPTTRACYVVAYDFGIKRSILASSSARAARSRSCRRRRPRAEVLAREPDGVFLSNGPGDPAAVGVRASTTSRRCSARCRCSASASATRSWASRSARDDVQAARSATTAATTRCATSRPAGSRSPARTTTTRSTPTSLAGRRDVTHVNLNDGDRRGHARADDAPRVQRAVPPRGRARARTTRATCSTSSPTSCGRAADGCRAATDLETILLIGSGPIVIGQACEFDYSGTQACRVLREEGYRVVLVNSNPATIMTDPEFADATYVEPLDVAIARRASSSRSGPTRCCRRSAARPASTSRSSSHEAGVLDAVRRRDDRRERRGDPHRRGPPAVQGRDDRDRPARAAVGHRVHARRGAARSPSEVGYPVIVRPAFILGGGGTGIAATTDARCERVAERGLAASPISRDPHRAQSIAGWKEYELEVMRDHADNVRRHLLDREPRPDGRAHRRLDHGRARADAHRRRVPAHARRRVRVHPPHRRRDRRLERAVRGRTRATGEHGRHRDEPARVAVVARWRARPPASRSPRSRPSSRSATASTRSRNDITGETPASASSRPSTTSSPRSRAGRSRSCPARRRCSARRCSRSAR